MRGHDSCGPPVGPIPERVVWEHCLPVSLEEDELAGCGWSMSSHVEAFFRATQLPLLTVASALGCSSARDGEGNLEDASDDLTHPILNKSLQNTEEQCEQRPPGHRGPGHPGPSYSISWKGLRAFRPKHSPP